MWHPADIEDISVLIIAYQRVENVERILSKIATSGIKNIFISLDYPSTPDTESLNRQEEIVKIVKKFASNPVYRVRLATFSRNVGCGVAVIKACDWFFNSVEFGVVLEDDCIPTRGFFNYMQYALGVMRESKEIYIASGSRLHPCLDGTQWELNNFPIFWGWGSTSNKWKFLSSQIKEPLPALLNYPSRFSVQSFYWRAGSRRVRHGFVDTWDTLISELFYRNNLKNLSPSISLVQNIGDDEHATHAMSQLKNLPKAEEEFSLPKSLPIFEVSKNKEIGKYLYKYRAKHIVTTTLNQILDLTFRSYKADKPFKYRVEIAKSHYVEVT